MFTLFVLGVFGGGIYLIYRMGAIKSETYHLQEKKETQYERAKRKFREDIERKKNLKTENEVFEVEIIESPKNTYTQKNEIKNKFREFTANEKKEYAAKQKENKIKGKAYEEQVAYHYRSRGYDVIEHGKIKGKKDGGIDLIASNNNETILIQCKNWKARKITHSHLKEFLYNGKSFIENNNLFGNINFMYIISNEILDKSAKGFIIHSDEKINYQVVPYLEN